MQLLNREIDIIPGRRGASPSQATYEGQSIPGSTVVQLSNPTSQENAFLLRLTCQNPYWKEDWYTLSLLPPSAQEESAASVKPPQFGPRGRWIKVYVPRGGVRHVLVRFHVPRAPVSRAGRYRFDVEIERQITDKPATGLRSDHNIQLSGIATILPYYEWSVDLSPTHPKFYIYQRSVQLDIVVTNEGNDWLYCELKLPEQKELTLETPTLIVAVPPPEPGQVIEGKNTLGPHVGAQRRIPLTASTRLTPIVGPPIAQPLAISATRIDAPTTGQSSDLADTGLAGLSFAKPTEERLSPQVPRAAFCYPLIHYRLTRIYGAGTSLIRSLLTQALTALTLSLGLVLAYQHLRYHDISIEPEQVEVMPGAELKVRGKSLEGARITLNNRSVALGPATKDPDIYSIIVPQELAGAKAKLKAQRYLDFLPPMLNGLNGLLPFYEARQDVKIKPLDLPPPTGGAPPKTVPGKMASSSPKTPPAPPVTGTGNRIIRPAITIDPLPPQNPFGPGMKVNKMDTAATQTPAGGGAFVPTGGSNSSSKGETPLPGMAGATGMPGSGVATPGAGASAGAGASPPATPSPAPIPDYSYTLAAPFQQLQHLGAIQAQNQTSDLINRATAVLELNPDSPAARAMRGYLMVQTGHLDTGKRDLDAALALEPQNAQARTGLARYWAARATRATKTTRKGTSASRAVELLAYGELNAHMALTIDPASALAKYALAVIHYRCGRYALAEALCTELLPKEPNPTDPGFAPIYLLRGQSLAAHEQLRAASLDLLAAKRLDPALPGLKEALAAINK